jgi:hypothetical protein
VPVRQKEQHLRADDADWRVPSCTSAYLSAVGACVELNLYVIFKAYASRATSTCAGAEPRPSAAETEPVRHESGADAELHLVAWPSEPVHRGPKATLSCTCASVNLEPSRLYVVVRAAPDLRGPSNACPRWSEQRLSAEVPLSEAEPVRRA